MHWIQKKTYKNSYFRFRNISGNNTIVTIKIATIMQYYTSCPEKGASIFPIIILAFLSRFLPREAAMLARGFGDRNSVCLSTHACFVTKL